jgi:hypothetical protein
MQARVETTASDTLSQDSRRPTILTIEMFKTPFARQSLCGRAGPTNAIWQYRRGVEIRRLLVGQQHGNLAV